MKTKIELLGFEVEIEEVDGKLKVEVEWNDETIEELLLDPAEYEGEESDSEDDMEDDMEEGDEDVKDFDQFAGEGDEDEDNDSEELPEDEDRALESFDAWTKTQEKCDNEDCECGDDCECGPDCNCASCKEKYS